jgi:hypothetical protein
VRSSIHLKDIVPFPFGPSYGYSFPSRFVRFVRLIGPPAASMPVVLATIHSPSSVYTLVTLLGAGPGSNFDLGTFIFHVPTIGSAARINPGVKRRHTISRRDIAPLARHPNASAAQPPSSRDRRLQNRLGLTSGKMLSQTDGALCGMTQLTGIRSAPTRQNSPILEHPVKEEPGWTLPGSPNRKEIL